MTYTLKHRWVDCPMWKDQIMLTAKSVYTDEDNPYEARFMSATCEVIENLKLPERKQNKRLALYRFCRMSDTCPHLCDFADRIDVCKP